MRFSSNRELSKLVVQTERWETLHQWVTRVGVRWKRVVSRDVGYIKRKEKRMGVKDKKRIRSFHLQAQQTFQLKSTRLMWLAHCCVPDTKGKTGQCVFRQKTHTTPKMGHQLCFPFVLRTISLVLFTGILGNNQDFSTLWRTHAPQQHRCPKVQFMRNKTQSLSDHKISA